MLMMLFVSLALLVLLVLVLAFVPVGCIGGLCQDLWHRYACCLQESFCLVQLHNTAEICHKNRPPSFVL